MNQFKTTKKIKLNLTLCLIFKENFHFDSDCRNCCLSSGRLENYLSQKLEKTNIVCTCHEMR